MRARGRPPSASGLWWAVAFAALASFAVGVTWFLRGTWRDGVIGTDRTEQLADRHPQPADGGEEEP